MFEATFTAGDSFSELRSWPAYPASAGWVLKLRLVPRSNAGAVIDLTAAAEGDDHRFTALASVTGGWSAGSYGWAEWVERGAEVYTTATGQAVIAPDPRAASAGSAGGASAGRARTTPGGTGCGCGHSAHATASKPSAAMPITLS